MWTKIKTYLRQGLWEFSVQELNFFERFFFRGLRVAVLAIRGFFVDGCSLRASSLTFYTLLSIVPILALVFAIAQGFGLQEYLEARILERFEENRAFLLELFLFSNRLLEQAKGGVIAGTGAVILFWSATSLLSSMEDSFNRIWKVKRKRSWKRGISDYFAIILIAPLLFLLSSSLSLFLFGLLNRMIANLLAKSAFEAAALFAIQIVPYLLLWILYAFLFYFLPNTKVRFVSALAGAFVAGALLLLVQAGYFYFQMNVTRYSAIYGSFAAIPLFMIWVQINWFILLFGVQISHACQVQEQHEYAVFSSQLSHYQKIAFLIWMGKISMERILKEEPITFDFFFKEKKIPYSLVRFGFQELSNAQILAEIKEEKGRYLPVEDLRAMKISDLIEALEGKEKGAFSFATWEEVAQIEKFLDSFSHLIEKSGKNYTLAELCKHLSP